MAIRPNILLLDFLDLDFDAAEGFGEEVVDRADEAEAHEADDGHHEWHPEEEKAAHDFLHVSPALREDDGGGDPVDEAEEEVEGGDDLAALQNADAGDLFFHKGETLRGDFAPLARRPHRGQGRRGCYGVSIQNCVARSVYPEAYSRLFTYIQGDLADYSASPRHFRF